VLAAIKVKNLGAVQAMFSTAGDTEEVPEPTSNKTEGSILGELSMAEKLAKFKSAAAKVGTDEMPVVFDRGALPLNTLVFRCEKSEF
jgi:hypothetical protein